MKLPNTFICPNDKQTRISFANCKTAYDKGSDVLTVGPFTCPKCQVVLTCTFLHASRLSLPTILPDLQQPQWTRQGT